MKGVSRGHRSHGVVHGQRGVARDRGDAGVAAGGGADQVVDRHLGHEIRARPGDRRGGGGRDRPGPGAHAELCQEGGPGAGDGGAQVGERGGPGQRLALPAQGPHRGQVDRDLRRERHVCPVRLVPRLPRRDRDRRGGGVADRETRDVARREAGRRLRRVED